MNDNQLNTNYVLSTNIEIITESGIQINGLSNINQELSCHYLIYRIDNLINGKYYIGQHQTEYPLDKYMGSGKILKRAIYKEGLSSFIKTILFDFDNFDDMNNKEIELVQLSNCFPYDQISYNLTPGGSNHCVLYGEQNGMYGKHISSYMELSAYQKFINNTTIRNRERAKDPLWIAKMSEVTSGEKNGMYGKSIFDFMTEEEITQWKSNISKATSGKNNGMYGKSSWEKCTFEQRSDRIKRYSQSMKGKNKGKTFVQLPGTNELKFIKKEDLQTYLDQGYLLSNTHNKRKEIYNMKPLSY